jgi:hypothetical protein
MITKRTANKIDSAFLLYQVLVSFFNWLMFFPHFGKVLAGRLDAEKSKFSNH